MGLDTAMLEYCALKKLMREADPETLGWYESDRADWHYSRIARKEFRILLYRVIWSSGFRFKTVQARENAFFAAVNRYLFRRGKFLPEKKPVFLKNVASILGGHAENRKNRNFADALSLIESLGWSAFKNQYLSPSPNVDELLMELPGIGPKTVKLLLSHTGIEDTPKDDIWVTRFSWHHGFADPFACVKAVSRKSKDDQILIDAVIFWSGVNGHGSSWPSTKP